MPFSFKRPPRPVADAPDTVDAVDAVEAAAYQRGRRDEARRRRSPLTTMLVGGAALVGVATLGFAAVNGGSFSAGGQAIDRSLMMALSNTGPALRDLAVNSSQGLNALKDKLHRTGPKGA
jgi:hypothetical protein